MAGLVNLDVGSALTGVFNLVDELFTSDDERATARLKVLELHSRGKLAQLAVNAAEAKHTSVFVAGWRPAIGWLCGAVFGWNLIFRDITLIALEATGVGIPFDLPAPSTFEAMILLTGMLGISHQRTKEKIEGVARESFGSVPAPKPTKGEWE